MDNFFGEIVFGYSRRQAIEDGILIDATELARQIGFKVHTAITSSLVAEIHWETQLPVLLQTFHEKIVRDQNHSEIIMTQTASKNGFPITIVFHIGGGDNGEPVLTLMLPEDM